jgi:hypothetical protein
MDPKTAKTLAEMHLKLADEYRDAAGAACEARDPFEVWRLVKESMAQETKGRALKRRYLQA